MRIRITDPYVRLPKHPSAKFGVIEVGAVIDVDKALALRLVGRDRAEFVEDGDVPRGPMTSLGDDAIVPGPKKKPASMASE